MSSPEVPGSTQNRYSPPGFQSHLVGPGCEFLTGCLPQELLNSVSFDALWELHPDEFPEIHLHGHRVPIPRWQQAYGVDYHFSGQVSPALAVPDSLGPLLRWSQTHIDAGLNGLLLNWYDGHLGHYIGRHRDSVKNLIPGSGIVTVSLGEGRIFRLRPWPYASGNSSIDFPTHHGSVFVLPWETNRHFTHEVTKSSKLTGRRISVTLRAFKSPTPVSSMRQART